MAPKRTFVKGGSAGHARGTARSGPPAAAQPPAFAKGAAAQRAAQRVRREDFDFDNSASDGDEGYVSIGRSESPVLVPPDDGNGDGKEDDAPTSAPRPAPVVPATAQQAERETLAAEVPVVMDMDVDDEPVVDAPRAVDAEVCLSEEDGASGAAPHPQQPSAVSGPPEASTATSAPETTPRATLAGAAGPAPQQRIVTFAEELEAPVDVVVPAGVAPAATSERTYVPASAPVTVAKERDAPVALSAEPAGMVLPPAPQRAAGPASAPKSKPIKFKMPTTVRSEAAPSQSTLASASMRPSLPAVVAQNAGSYRPAPPPPAQPLQQQQPKEQASGALHAPAAQAMSGARDTSQAGTLVDDVIESGQESHALHAHYAAAERKLQQLQVDVEALCEQAEQAEERAQLHANRAVMLASVEGEDRLAEARELLASMRASPFLKELEEAGELEA